MFVVSYEFECTFEHAGSRSCFWFFGSRTFMLEHAVGKGARKFKMHAQVHLEEFYQEFGFRREGGVFEECGIDHIYMVREED